MDDLTIRLLLSRFIKQLLTATNKADQSDLMALFGEQEESELRAKLDLFADEVALTAWNSLIYLLRQSFVKAKQVNLPEVGEFIKQERAISWSFFPAASLAQADAAALTRNGGNEYMAKLALHQLKQGLETANLVTADVSVPQSVFVELFADLLPEEGVPTHPFSEELLRISEGIEAYISRFKTEEECPVPESVGSVPVSIRSENTIRSESSIRSERIEGTRQTAEQESSRNSMEGSVE